MAVETEAPPRPARLSPFALVAALTVMAGVVLRFVTTSSLWLDEAQSVAIAQVPVDQIGEALHHDGSPPLYYLLLHGWMALLGDGDAAVRALSGVCSVAAIAVTAAAVSHLAGRRAALYAAVLLATNPFAIRYATEARMYGLVALEVAVAILAGIAIVQRRRAPWAAPVLALATAAILYTHYWGVYAVAAAGLVLLGWYAATPSDRRTIRPLLLAGGIGIVAWLPWLPTFAYQLEHTGTPWADAPPPATVVTALFDLNGGLTGGGLTLTLLGIGAAVLALFAHRSATDRIELGRPVRRPAAMLAALVVLSLAIGIGAGLTFGVAFANRYATVALVPFVMLVALGLDRLHATPGRVLVALTAGVGLVTAGSSVTAQRTQAPQFAAALADAAPGDVVVVCPDQLGPATYRLLGDRLSQMAYPRGDTPASVDWVDYGDAWRDADPTLFAARADALAAGNTLWLVLSTGYHGTEDSCRDLLAAMEQRRPGAEVAVAANGNYFENGTLWELPAP